MNIGRIDWDDLTLDPLCKMSGVKIDGHAIGRDLYDILEPEHIPPLALGMAPALVMAQIEQTIKDKLGRIAADHFGAPEIAAELAKCVKKSSLAKIMKDVYLGLLAGADEAGVLRV